MCDKHSPNPMRWFKGQMMKRMHGMITCKEFEDFVLSYLDGELSAKQTQLFNWHLYFCRECRDYLKAYKTSIEMSKLLGEEITKPNADEAPEDLIKAILAAKE